MSHTMIRVISFCLFVLLPSYLGGDFISTVGQVVIKRVRGQGASNAPSKGFLKLTDSWATNPYGWSRVQTVIHEMGHIVTYNQPKTLTYFMNELQATCTGGSTYYGVPFCFQNNGQYNPGPYTGVNRWDQNTLQPGPDTHTPSPYSESGNWEDYAETFYTVVLEAYVNSGDKNFLNADTIFLNNSRYKDIGKRRDVMKAIIHGTWSASVP